MSHIKASRLWRNLRSTANKSLCSLGPCSTMTQGHKEAHYTLEKSLKLARHFIWPQQWKVGQVPGLFRLSFSRWNLTDVPFYLGRSVILLCKLHHVSGTALVFPQYSVDAATPYCNCQVIKFCHFSKACQQQ